MDKNINANPTSGDNLARQTSGKCQRPRAAHIFGGLDFQIPNHPGQYKPIADPELILTILNLANMTPAGTSIAYDPRYGLGWVDPKGWKVYFGFNMVGLDSKLAQYAGIVTNLSNQGIQPKIISIQYPYAPFYRLEQ